MPASVQRHTHCQRCSDCQLGTVNSEAHQHRMPNSLQPCAAIRPTACPSGQVQAAYWKSSNCTAAWYRNQQQPLAGWPPTRVGPCPRKCQHLPWVIKASCTSLPSWINSAVLNYPQEWQGPVGQAPYTGAAPGPSAGHAHAWAGDVQRGRAGEVGDTSMS